MELFVAEVGDTADDDQVYRLTYDGSVADEHGLRRHGRVSADWSVGYVKEHYQPTGSTSTTPSGWRLRRSVTTAPRGPPR